MREEFQCDNGLNALVSRSIVQSYPTKDGCYKSQNYLFRISVEDTQNREAEYHHNNVKYASPCKSPAHNAITITHLLYLPLA